MIKCPAFRTKIKAKIAGRILTLHLVNSIRIKGIDAFKTTLYLQVINYSPTFPITQVSSLQKIVKSDSDNCTFWVVPF